MAKKKQTAVNVVESLLAEVVGHLRSESTTMVERLSTAGSERAHRLESVTARLSEALGDDHPRVIQLRQRADVLGGFASKLDASVERLQAVPTLRPHEWMAHGRVLGDGDEPLPGLRVVVFDQDREGTDLLVDAITDSWGEFRGIYHERDFRDEGEEVPELTVMVYDGKGKPVFRSDPTFQASSTRSDFIQIVLTAERLKDGIPRTQCQAKTAKGQQCRNQALAGHRLCARHMKRP